MGCYLLGTADYTKKGQQGHLGQWYSYDYFPVSSRGDPWTTVGIGGRQRPYHPIFLTNLRS
jgi:hypothetical protein